MCVFGSARAIIQGRSPPAVCCACSRRLLAHLLRCARRLEGPLRGELLNGNLPQRTAGIGASRPLPRTPAKVSRPHRHRPFGPGRRNGSSCPTADLGAAKKGSITDVARSSAMATYIALHEVGVPFEARLTPLSEGAHKRPEYL